jgi:glutathione S-transferase
MCEPWRRGRLSRGRMPHPILYSFRRCPYAMRARMALLVGDISFEIREIVLRAKPPEMLAASPKGTVPVLVCADGEVIDESLDIIEWALAQNDPENWLSWHDPALIATFDSQFKHHLDRTKYPQKFNSNAIEHREAALTHLQAIEIRLGQSAFLHGPNRALTDIALMPFIRQFAAIDPAWFAVQPLPNLQSWLERLIGSDLFERAMSRLKPWSAGDRPLFWP